MDNIKVKMYAAKLQNLNKYYRYLVLLRIVLVFLPQTGYIHPDEYFQSIEVLAGKVLSVEASQPWEFNITFPIRSMAVPYFTIGLSFNALKITNHFTEQLFNKTILSSYMLLLFPRLLMCSLSFLVDFSLYKLCANNNEKYNYRLIILASSFVMLVFATRTFSNTIELILFALLLYYVADSLTFSNIVQKERDYLNLRYKKAKDPVERAKFHKLRLFLTTDSLRNVVQISIISVLGFFNRPTFLFFAVMPVFFWLYRGLGYKSVVSMQFHLRMLVFILCSIPTIIFIIVVDSFYYGYISWGEIGMLDVSINSFIFTPLNFFKYNINAKNLVQHGLHSRYVHLLVNVPLLFNILGIFGMFGVLDILYKISKHKYHLLPTIRTIKALMIASMITPVILLSLVPHQEPRFLIPIIVPLTYLYASSILEETDTSIIQAPKISQKKTDLEIKPQSYAFLKLWLYVNLVLTIFYGFMHQGGVYPVASYLSNQMKTESPLTNFHIFTSHIYMVPESLFLQKAVNKLYFNDKVKYQVSKRVYLYEEGSKNLNRLFEKLLTVRSVWDQKKNLKRYSDNKYLLVIPSSMDFYVKTVNKNFTSVVLIKEKTFYPHLSTEAFPVLEDFSWNYSVSSLLNFSQTVVQLCGLTLYEVSFVDL